jgi:hypothetical protein
LLLVLVALVEAQVVLVALLNTDSMALCPN